MDAPWENRGPCNCETCGVACYADELTQTPAGDLLCDSCEERRLAVESELRAERRAEILDAECQYEPRGAF